MKHRLLIAAAVLSALPASVLAQTPPPSLRALASGDGVAQSQAPAAAVPQGNMPPAGSGPVFRSLAPRCEPGSMIA